MRAAGVKFRCASRRKAGQAAQPARNFRHVAAQALEDRPVLLQEGALQAIDFSPIVSGHRAQRLRQIGETALHGSAAWPFANASPRIIPVAFNLSRTFAPRSDSRRKSKSETVRMAASCTCQRTTSWFNDCRICFKDRRTVSRVRSC